MTWWSWPLGIVEFLVAWMIFDGPLRGKLRRACGAISRWLDEFNSYQPDPVSVQPFIPLYTGKSICWNCDKPHDGPVGRCPECAKKYGRRVMLGQPPVFGSMATELRDHLRRYPEDREKLIARFGAAWVPPRPAPDFGRTRATEMMWHQL
jgi:hypothetical protein